MSMLYISKFSSLNFFHGWKLDFEKDDSYCQVFSSYDIISVQYTIPAGNQLRAVLTREDTQTEMVLSPVLIYSHATEDTYQVSVLRPEAGKYTFSIEQRLLAGYERLAWSYFHVLEAEELENTILFTYTHNDNTKGTLFLNEDGTQNVFQFRIPGGFLSNAHERSVENETFRTQRFESVQLEALPYTVKILTIGNGYGVPNWVAEKVNYIFSLLEVMINGVYHTRSESSIPEQTEIMEGRALFVYKMNVEESNINYAYEAGMYLAEWILENGWWNKYGLWTEGGLWK